MMAMECRAATSTPLLFTLRQPSRPSSKSSVFLLFLARHFCRSYRNRDVLRPFCWSRCLADGNLGRLRRGLPVGYVANCVPAFLPSMQHCVASLSSTAAIGASGGGGGGVDDGDGGDRGGGDGSSSPTDAKSLAGDSEEVMAASVDVIVLDVGGMSCGGCAASVKRILESQVSAANVNLATETAVVWPVPEVRDMQNWKQELGEKLAAHLTSCGFKSNLRTFSREDLNSVFERKRMEKLYLLKESGRNLAVSWALCAVCLVGHALHFIGANVPSWIHALHSVGFHMSLSILTLFGPGRQIMYEGIKSLLRGAPNMNTLVSLGAISSFTVSSIAVLLPKLGWKTFFEEPIMLLAFVLLGRNLEHRAKIKATSDMTGLLSVLPRKARLVMDNDMEGSHALVDVPCDTLSIGDKIVVLPGDRIPVDGAVVAGRSSVDESSFTGEPLPVLKLHGNKVNAGTININGKLTIEVRRPGGESLISDIVRLVTNAQNRQAPVQCLADKVAGVFTYGVIALSAATFLVWKNFGSQVLPSVIQHGGPVSLALQLSCSVLVVACPCALGLATPTAVLVGTSLGATRGMLIRGGDILEKFASVDTVVFDKTGTLTTGKPIVTKVITISSDGANASNAHLEPKVPEFEILRLAAAVESNSSHPIGKAIVKAAEAVGCTHGKAVDGSFKEEPGAGAMAVVEHKEVLVGTQDWLLRNGVGNYAFPRGEDPETQSVAYVGVDGFLVGLIYVEDTIRDDAVEVVKSLSEMGISTYMLSGDKEHSAGYVASIVGIPKDKVVSGVKPDGKLSFIHKLQKERKTVAMVGDGINDAAALASASVGVAMGGGVGVASEASSVVLMGDKLTQVGLPIAAGLLLPFNGPMLTPSIAGALMGLSSVCVMANSLLLRIKYGVRRPLYKPSSKEMDSSNHQGNNQLHKSYWKNA
ncbi:Copper-transporting ATPase [Nymphaea thermarum]|nr:Copper-transporting ATPase [Nymphaea thermarum]